MKEDESNNGIRVLSPKVGVNPLNVTVGCACEVITSEMY